MNPITAVWPGRPYVHAFVDDRRLVERGLTNYWGYNTIGFFAPEAYYSIELARR